MIDRNDIFIVRVKAAMITKSVEYARKSLHYTFNRMGKGNIYARIRNIVSGVIMENAFKRLLDYHNVSYELLGNTHWTKKDKYDVGVRGDRCDIKGFFIGNSEKSKKLKKDKGWLLDCSALVPVDQIDSRTLKNNDKYVFPFLTGRYIGNNQGVNSLFTEPEKKYLVHIFKDYSWIRSSDFRTLGKIVVESKMRDKIQIVIGGQDKSRELIVEEILMMPMSKQKTNIEFYTLLFVQTDDRPTGELIIESHELNKKEIIEDFNWENIWLYDGLVYFTGYMNKGEFKEKSKYSPRFSKDIKQYFQTRTNNRKIQIQSLHSLREILPHDCDLYVP